MGSPALEAFRPAQFSEDAAWLPIWLQQQNVEPFNEGINGGETPFDQRVKELQLLQQEINKEENANLSRSGEGGYKSCHLLLSEDEISPHCFAASNDNVINFHLHLSADSNSECLANPLKDSSQVQGLVSNRVVLKQPVGMSVVSEGKINHSDVGCNPLFVNHSPNSRCLNENHIPRHEGNVGFCQVDDISEAVELSIAASEALVIHEIMTGIVTKPFLATMVLEAAIQLKQARLDIWNETSQCSSMHIGEMDFHSVMHDLTVEDAYENVGLSIDPSIHENDVSQVKDTFDLENHRHEGNSEHEETIGFVKTLDDFEVQIADKGLHDEMKVEEISASEIFCGNRCKELLKNSSVCLDSASKDCSTSSPVDCSEQENLQVSASVELADYGVGKDDCRHAHAQSSFTRTSEASEKYSTAVNFLPRRFQSRWLGGWAWKEDEKPFAQMEHREIQGIPKPFVNEMSYLSESADVALDENSVLQKRSKRTNPSSQASIPSEIYCNKADREINSQDVMRCSSLSVGDPLCSVVACSFSSENICSTALLKHEHDISGNCSIAKPEYTTDNLQRTSTAVELVHAEQHIVPVTYSELLPVVHRQFTSLKPYSVMAGNPGGSLAKENSCRGTFPTETMPKLSMMENPFSNLTGIKSFNKPVENGPFTMYLWNNEKMSTPILDHRQEKSAMQGGSEVFAHNKKLPKVQSTCENQNSSQIPARKRVHFVDAGTNNFPKKKLSKYRASLKDSHTSRASKKLRTTNRHCDSGGQEQRRCQRNCFSNKWLRLLFRNMEFLLTGFSIQKEKQFEGLIKEYGGIILSDIPSPKSRGNRISRFSSHKLPIVLSSKKMETIKFLYGCAVNALVLKADWLTDSIVAGLILPPQQYSILHESFAGCFTRSRLPFSCNFRQPIFDNFGIMLHGKNNFCIQMGKIIKHGGGKVFKTLKFLVDNINTERISQGAIVVENESRASRHLKQCALEYEIPMMSSHWIIKSLHNGKLLPFNEKKNSSCLTTSKLPNCLASIELSEEI
ncbi:uncharacterized protein [Coffea arabica]|uniref:Uncharacterized protein isoform X1 n=1 Tax=Coffea arabica TaxID=13443 RepID=A0ABM4WJV4_COFAR